MQESQEFESTGRPGVPARLSSHDDALHQGLTVPLIEELFGTDSYARLTATLRNELGTSGPLQEALLGRITHHGAVQESRECELMDRPLKPAGLPASPAQSRGDALSHGPTAATLHEEPAAPTAIAPCPPKGGPRTLEGKARSRTNALRHGLTDTTLINAVLPANRVNELRAELSAEIGPRTVIERLLVDEVARHAAMLELGERAELAVLRRGAAVLAPFGVDAFSGSVRRQSDVTLFQELQCRWGDLVNKRPTSRKTWQANLPYRMVCK